MQHSKGLATMARSHEFQDRGASSRAIATSGSNVVGVVLATFVTAAPADLVGKGNDADHSKDGEDRDKDHAQSLGGTGQERRSIGDQGRKDRPMISFMISVVPP